MTERGVNLLDVITKDRELPEGCNAWAIRTVRPDLTSKHGFVYPFPGNWAEAPGPIVQGSHECPRLPGDGICAALDWEGMASGGVAARTLLLVAYSATDLLGSTSHKLRLRRMFVVALIDGEKVVTDLGVGANLAGANLTGANLTGADLTGADLTGANLTRAYLTGAYLTRAHLAGADLTRAHLAGAHLAGADLTGAYLAGADLTRAYLAGADLTGADLTGANLTRAYLTGAYLAGAYLTGADLTRAHLAGAHLTGAYLAGADLTRANLTRADLTGADLTGAQRQSLADSGWKISASGLVVRA